MLECWTYTGLATRMILPLGMNVRSAELSLKSVMLPPPADALEREERRATVWMAFHHDTVRSTTASLSLLISGVLMRDRLGVLLLGGDRPCLSMNWCVQLSAVQKNVTLIWDRPYRFPPRLWTFTPAPSLWKRIRTSISAHSRPSES